MTAKSILGNTRRADISFFSSGRIDITSRIVKVLSLKSGDVVDVMRMGNEFYLYVPHRAEELFGKHEAQCYPSKRGGRHFRGYSHRLCEAILKECGESHRANLAAGMVTEVNGYVAVSLITRNNINRS